MEKHEAWVREQAGKPTLSPFPKEVFTTHVTNQRAMDFIEREAGGPFAAWISILDPMEFENAHGRPEYRKVEQELPAELATMK